MRNRLVEICGGCEKMIIGSIMYLSSKKDLYLLALIKYYPHEGEDNVAKFDIGVSRGMIRVGFGQIRGNEEIIRSGEEMIRKVCKDYPGAAAYEFKIW